MTAIRRLLFRASFLSLAVVSTCLLSVKAQTAFIFTQPATGTAANMSVVTNWSGGLTPVSGLFNTIDFNTLGGNTNAFTLTNDVGPLTMNGLTFKDMGTAAFTLALGVNPMTLDGANPFLNLAGGSNATISGAGGVLLNANTTVGGSGNGALTISSVISGAGGLVINQSGNGIFNLTGANTFLGGVTLNQGTLQLGSASALGSALNSLTINGGQVRFGAASTIANNIVANSTFVIAGGTGSVTATSSPILTGVISGNGGLTIQNYSPTGTTSGAILQGINTYTGVTNVTSAIPFPSNPNSAPTLTLSGLNGSILGSQTINVFQNATLSLSNAAGAVNGNRINDTAAINLHGGRFTFNPGVAGTTETVGNLTISGNAHLSTTTAGLSNWNFGSFTRQGNATLWLDTVGFGTIQSATIATRVTFAGATAASMGVVTPGSGVGQELGLLPYAVGSSATNPRSFVTYDGTVAGGLQLIPFNNATYVLQQAAGAVSSATVNNKNIHLNGAGTYTFSGVNVLNGISTTSSTVTVTGGTLQIWGPIVNFDGLVFTGTTLDYGNRTGYIHNSWNTSIRGTATITGTAGLVISTGATPASRAFLFDTSVANTFTGGLTLTGNAHAAFFRDDQLGAAGESITMAGGALSYNGAGNVTINRPIIIEQTNGGFSFNLTNANTGNTAAAATATTVATLSGVISGAGAFVKEGVGIVNLTGANSYGGGTVISAGTLQVTNDGNLGAAGTRLVLNGGTFNPLAALSTNRSIDVNASSTINNANSLTLSGTMSNIGALHGTAFPTLTKTGAGALVISGDANKLAGNIAISTGSFTLSGNGGIRGVSNVTLAANTTLTLDNTSTYDGDRIGDHSAISLNGAGSVFTYIAPGVATSDPAERIGVFNNTVAGGVFNIVGSAASGTVLRLNTLNATAGLTIRGDQLGAVALGPNVTRLLIDSFTSNVTILSNVFYAGTSGTGTSSQFAGYDTVRGIIPFTPPTASGTIINNFAPDNVNTFAAYTTTGDTTAFTGAHIFSLNLNAGFLLNFTFGNAASPTNNNTPDGTLTIASGILSSNNGAKFVDSFGTGIMNFGAAAGLITTNSNLDFSPQVTLVGTGGLTKAGNARLHFDSVFSVTGAINVNAGILSTTGSVNLTSLGMNGGTYTTNNAPLTTTTVSGTGGTINLGTGSLTATDITMASGAINSNGGTVAATTINMAAGTINTNGGAVTATTSISSATGSINTGGGAVTAGVFGGAATINAGAGQVTINGTGTNTYSGVINSSLGLIRLGTGNQTLSAAQNVGNATLIQQGVITLGINNALPTATTLTIGDLAASNTNSQLNLGGFNQTLASLTIIARGSGSVPAVGGAGVLTVNGDIRYVDNTNAAGNAFQGAISAGFLNLGGATQNIIISGQNNGVSPGDFTINSVIQNGGINYTGNPSSTQLVPTGLSLNAANTYAGPTIINRGNLNALVVGALPTGTNVSVNAAAGNSAILNLGANQTITSLSATSAGTNSVTLGANRLTVNGATSTTFNGVVSGTGGLSKDGSSTLTLTGTNTYTGTTQVNGGILQVNGSLGNTATTVGVAGTLAGTGTIGGAVTVNGLLTPGTSPGTLTINNNLTFGDGGSVFFEILGLAAGTEYDRVNLTAATSAYTIGNNVAFLATRGTFVAPFESSYVIFNNSNTTANSGTGTFAGLADGAFFSIDSQAFQIRYNVGTFHVDAAAGGIIIDTAGGSIVIAAVPEPTTYILVGVGVASALGVWRYRTRKDRASKSLKKRFKV